MTLAGGVRLADHFSDKRGEMFQTFIEFGGVPSKLRFLQQRHCYSFFNLKNNRRISPLRPNYTTLRLQLIQICISYNAPIYFTHREGWEVLRLNERQPTTIPSNSRGNRQRNKRRANIQTYSNLDQTIWLVGNKYTCRFATVCNTKYFAVIIDTILAIINRSRKY